MPEDDRRFLIGYGERLTERVAPPPGGGGPEAPYSLAEAISRLQPLVEETASDLSQLPDEACPGDLAVGIVTMHPQGIAKSYHPRQLLAEFGLRQVGSRPAEVTPTKWTRQDAPRSAPTTELFVAGPREGFSSWSETLSSETLVSPLQVGEQDQLRRIEAVRAPRYEDRFRGTLESHDRNLFEVVVHANSDSSSQLVLAAFDSYARSLGAVPDLDRRLFAGGLCFLPVDSDPAVLRQLSQFAFLRVVRPMPRLRGLPPLERAFRIEVPPCPLPDADPVDPDLRVAIFDGGLPEGSALGRWADAISPQQAGPQVAELAEHGHDVASALLFGPLVPGEPAPRPFCHVEVYQVLDEKSGEDPFELYDVLHRIQNVLQERRHKFFNLSLGPAVPIEDDEVHAWTAVLDEHLSDGDSLASVAIGNNGMENRFNGEARVQVPGDCVNALSVGSANSTRSGWDRAAYSAIGPGRSPGRIKPDIMHFGGDAREPFIVYDSHHLPQVAATQGTSFASPAALRAAVGVRAHFGERMSPLALKTILVHAADRGDRSVEEVGWGAIPASIDALVTCPNGSIRVLYQGELNPAQYLRALVPLPPQEISGMVTIKATVCYTTPIDPQDPGTYTQSGLDIVFRPHASKFKAGAVDPKSRPFFRRSDYDSEQILRGDALKWETTMQASQRLRGKSLLRPVFDIHYNARESGGAPTGANKIRYALLVSVESERATDIYAPVLEAYAGVLETMQPRVDIPVRI